MPVYFARAGADGLVKIGFTKKLVARMRELQVGCPFKLEVIRTIEAERTHEFLFHLHYTNQWVRGEWFNFSPCMMSVTLQDVGLPESIYRRGYDAPLYVYLPEGTRAQLRKLTNNESATVRALVLAYINDSQKGDLEA